MTKGELRKARKLARAEGLPLTGDLAIGGRNETVARPQVRRAIRSRSASKAEQHARYLDCGPSNWDDR